MTKETNQSPLWIQGNLHRIAMTIDDKTHKKFKQISQDEERTVCGETREVIREFLGFEEID